MTSFASISDMRTAFDARTVASLSSDNDSGTEVAGTVTDAIARASGEIRSACRAGGVYSESDLVTLASNSDPLLRHLAVVLAMRNLYIRRGGIPSDMQGMIDDAVDTLERLRRGDRVLAVESAISAQSPSSYRPTEQESRDAFPASHSSLYPSFRRP